MKLRFTKYLAKLYFIGIVFALYYSEPSFARPIISGISASQINIDTKFTGAEILLFGAKGEAGNVIVTIRGPKKNYLMHKKDKFLGVWYNKSRLKFKDSYSYYAFFSTSNQVINEKLFSQLEIGHDNIKFNVNHKDKSKEDEFKIEFIDQLTQKDLYLSNPSPIEFLDETLFKVMLQFPKNILRGTYVVEIYLVDENNLVAFQAIPIYVNQVGFSANIDRLAHDSTILYGILAIIMAVTAGYLANFIFGRVFGR